MSGAVRSVPVEPERNGRHDDDEPPARLPQDLSARGVAEQIVLLGDAVDTAIDDVRELRARVIANETAAEQRGGWLLEALRIVGDEVHELRSTLGGVQTHVATATGDAREKIDTLSREDAEQDIAIAAAHERAAAAEAALSEARAETEAARILANVADKRARAAQRAARIRVGKIVGVAVLVIVQTLAVLAALGPERWTPILETLRRLMPHGG